MFGEYWQVEPSSLDSNVTRFGCRLGCPDIMTYSRMSWMKPDRSSTLYYIPSVNQKPMSGSRLLVKLLKKSFFAVSTTYSHFYLTHTLFLPLFHTASGPKSSPWETLPVWRQGFWAVMASFAWDLLLESDDDYRRSLLVTRKRQACERERVSTNTFVADPRYVDWKIDLQLCYGITFVTVEVEFS